MGTPLAAGRRWAAHSRTTRQRGNAAPENGLDGASERPGRRQRRSHNGKIEATARKQRGRRFMAASRRGSGRATCGRPGCRSGTGVFNIWENVCVRDLNRLPKAHLHLHFTGSMRVRTLERMAEAQGVRLPEGLTDNVAIEVPADQRGWFRFQRAYDAARKTVRSEEAMRTIVREAAEDDAEHQDRPPKARAVSRSRSIPRRTRPSSAESPRRSRSSWTRPRPPAARPAWMWP